MRDRPLPRLDRAYLDAIASGSLPAPPCVRLPPSEALEYPVRAVQFGTGAFVRGFVEHFIDEANRRGSFRGRVVAVGSTGTGRDRILERQDGLYTLASRGIVNGERHEEYRIISSLSRALSAQQEWSDVLAFARSPELEFVFSNTTEVGIVFDVADAFDASPPRSFPGKLTRFLYERAHAFGFADGKGLIVLPCELVDSNGAVLREIVGRVARTWSLSPDFLRWLDGSVTFCNTLVDRIVPGAPGPEDAEAMRDVLGYDDGMLTTCEPYRLFAIEGDASLEARLPFANASEEGGIVVTRDIRPYRERKVRLLNGAHTVMVSAALLSGCDTVQQAIEHPLVGEFARRAILGELLETVQAPNADAFARDVLDRFANPFIRHELFDITLQGTMKMRVRVVPAIVQLAERTGRAPASLTLGFAAFLHFMRGELQDRRQSEGRTVPQDDQSQCLRELWDRWAGEAAFAEIVCADEQLWGADLSKIDGFTASVAAHLTTIRRAGVERALEGHLTFTPGATPSVEPGLSLRTT